MANCSELGAEVLFYKMRQISLSPEDILDF
jgi:hypothetical protein